MSKKTRRASAKFEVGLEESLLLQDADLSGLSEGDAARVRAALQQAEVMRLFCKGAVEKEVQKRRTDGVFLAIALKEWLPFAFFQSYVGMNIHYAIDRVGGYLHTQTTTGAYIANSRNNMVWSFLKGTACSHILFLDCDMSHPADTISRLLAWKVDAVSGLYFKRDAMAEPLVYRRDPAIPEWTMYADVWYRDRARELGTPLIPVDGSGAGCLMLSRRCLSNMNPDWTTAETCPRWFGEEEDGKTVGEDFFFARRLKEAGFQLYVDTSLACKHWGLSGFGEYQFVAHEDEFKKLFGTQLEAARADYAAKEKERDAGD